MSLFPDSQLILASSVCAVREEGVQYTGRPKKMYLTLTLYFEAVTAIVSGLLDFPVFPDLYNSFDTLLICFHGLMNKSH